jgi:ketosteroid isomerase-like protein
MTLSHRIPLLLAVTFSLALPALGAPDEAGRIRAGTASWMQSFNSGNAGAVVALYSDDAVLMPPNMPLARGTVAIKEAVAKEIAGAKKGGVTLAQGTLDEINVAGDMAWHSGSYVVKDKAGKQVDAGKFLEVWEKKGGKWRIVRDMWNSDAAPGAAAAAAPAAPPAANAKKK